MGLRELQQARTNQPVPCKAARIIDTLEPADRECYDEWAEQPENVAEMVADLAVLTGERMSDNCMFTHLKGRCNCDGTR